MRSFVVQHASRAEVVDAEEVQADVVGLAAAAWTPALAAPLGIRNPLQPAKGCRCTVGACQGMRAGLVLIAERRVIITPLGDRLPFGGTLELAEFDPGIDGVRCGAVVRGTREVLRQPPPMLREDAWCGLRPGTPNEIPVVDRARAVEEIIVASGHARPGFTQAPITGKLVAELAGDLSPPVAVEAFRRDRFA